MANPTYSFQNVKASLAGPAGSITLSDGNGVAEEGITISYADDKATMTIGADGAGMHSLHAGKSGTVTIRLLKTNPMNKKLMDLYNYETSSAANYGQDTISVRDVYRGDGFTAAQCGFKKVPDISYAKDGSSLEWVFNAIRINGVLGSGSPEV